MADTTPRAANPTHYSGYVTGTPRAPEFLDLTDDEFLAYFRDEIGYREAPAEFLAHELLHRAPALRIAYHQYSYSFQEDDRAHYRAHKTAGTWDPMAVPREDIRSDRTKALADAFAALVAAIVYDDDTALRARPAIGLAEILDRAGIKRDTWHGYISRSQVAPRIGHDWHTGEQVWDRDQIELWLDTRRPTSGAARGTTSDMPPS